jgi:hydrogenase nickel incorporation protein HypB
MVKPASKLPEGELKYKPVDARAPAHHHHHHHQDHDHVVVDAATGDLHYGQGEACVSIPGVSQSRTIRLEQDVLGKNNQFAAHNREHFIHHRIFALNLVSSPGSGKTTLLCETIEALKRRGNALPVAVIEGDQQTSHDADRIRATGAPAIQVNTGKGCHLDAQMVGNAFSRLPLHAHGHEHGGHHHDDDGQGGILFIENVGNLVCPAMWDLGEAAKVAILSVTEGEDKPLKYPDMFAAAGLMILNKVDLLPYLRFDVQKCIDFARRVNPKIQVLQLSATSGQGMDAWLDWILDGHRGLAMQGEQAA